MNNIKQPDAPVKMRHSISNRLGGKLILRLIGLYISLNILIILISMASLGVYCEHAMVEALYSMSSPELPESDELLRHVRVETREIAENTVIATIHWPLSKLFPNETRSAARGFRSEDGAFLESVDSFVYVMNIEYDGRLIEMSLYIGRIIRYFLFAFAALLTFELFSLISRSISDFRMVRRALEPISGFARAAQNFGDAGRLLDHDKAMALAGRLDGIDGSHPDTRIPLDDLQEELRNVAVAINGMLDRIYEAYAAQARFVSDASHELRTPIAVIQGYANLLDRWGKEDENVLAESITAIRDEAQNMKDLVEQLLFLARGESNTIKLEDELINLDELILEVVTETRMLDTGHEISIIDGNAAVNADRALIKQALRILIDNAVKYTDIGGSITVSAERGEDTVRIVVSDSGVGIAPEILPYVFDRFVRADESRTRATGGAGLGLSIVGWIAGRHNGHIEALSREGIGTKMTLVIPVGRAG